MNRAPMQHKQEGRPQTLREALSFDQQRREAAYQEWLAAKQRFQSQDVFLTENPHHRTKVLDTD